ncbi:MAG TPA: acyl-CoA dehydrogenase C-terminal domain-containing protein [Lichenihabitans sp.]|jgi:hypothetical protein|nr:acyl-CoA dehydrogenase C-terminal domain-containing protein [Lichenihabitans sp.]
MPRYTAPVAEVAFLLDRVFPMEGSTGLPGLADLSPETLQAVLTQAGRFAETVLQPLNQSGDREGCRRHEDGSVETPPGFRAAYHRYVEGGWPAVSGDAGFGGQGLSLAVGAMVNEFCTSANMAFTMVSGLTQSACSAILAHGSAAQKALYVPKLVAGAWCGTMNLTEPQCGTDLGLIRTKAVPQADGSYRLFGQKIFISAGEHDLAENIVHLVLARIEGAPAGTKGLSLFVAPKLIVRPDGSLGPRNALLCGSIERKMGLHANPTCVMDYDGAEGELLGEAGRGLQAMFVMMNQARIGVATQGLALSEVAYQNAAAYAKERRQGRALKAPRSPEAPADPIIVHPDVRRALMSIRAFNLGARALLVWTALKADIARRSPDAAARDAAEDLLGLMTPVLKGVLTDTGVRNCIEAQQVFGGYGYIVEAGMEQFVRDARITAVYEGTNGIQALDLVGRKLPRDGGRAFTAFTKEVASFLKARAGDTRLAPFLGPLKQGLDHLQQATLWFMQHGLRDPDNAAAGAYDYMHMFGLVAIGYMWARIAAATFAGGDGDAPPEDGRLLFGRFFMERTMPETAAHLARITAGAATLVAPPAEAF